ncbi:molecular chaperone HtpG [Wenzhouxiangella sp. XN79A]|uniref:molecular chaperone HtpG n=1 Tax=Wenzhouxiangella sp. XN79A TaxID=2724193 RepID=UPI00144AA3E5|nr:molecular chaperone HtpG [Wenzhouxiangella sp. XN79A]NKI33797.1 molecular chaperone HtpG [Wenzhouxiangella sp. XN79A]
MSETPSTRSSADVETHVFGAEVHQLLKLMINALYSNREIFLRELVSNASDALDKLRFEALTDEGAAALAADPAIHVRFDAERGRLWIEDNGIGMTRQDVIDNLGTIARSGTARFLEQLSGDRTADARLIGQFGVGFYSAFIVADRVTVESRRVGVPSDQAVRWRSDGQGEYTLEAIERERPGTTVELEIGADHRDLLDAERLRSILKHYSNHVAFPIHLDGGAADDRESANTVEPINEAQALWTRPRQELGDEAYREFYEGLTGDTRPPSTWAHHHVEGTQSYSLLLYVPGQAPYDLAWNRDDRRGVRLYIQRVFIMDAAEQLVPRYLRFLRGVVDSADLPLNVSRELLQESPLLARIRAAVVKRGLAMIEKLAETGGAPWADFQRDFGAILKEGLIEDPDNRERIARLVRFSSTRDDAPHSVGLADYKARAGDGVEAIWYLTAESVTQAKTRPQLEAFRARDIEVLLMTDPIDTWVVGHLFEFDGTPLKPVSEGPPGDDADSDDAEEAAAASDARVERVAAALGERVGEVVLSRRLTDSPSCVVDPIGLDPRMRRMLEQAGQPLPPIRPRLEVNPAHPLVRLLGDLPDGDERIATIAELLFDEAVLLDGGELEDPAGFVRRVNAMLHAAWAGADAAAVRSPDHQPEAPNIGSPD